MENVKKMNKVERLKWLAKNKVGSVAFVVQTPGTRQNRAAQSVILRDFNVSKTQDGHFIVKGRNLEEEAKMDLKNSINYSLRKHREHDECVIKSYRIDRILTGSIIF